MGLWCRQLERDLEIEQQSIALGFAPLEHVNRCILGRRGFLCHHRKPGSMLFLLFCFYGARCLSGSLALFFAFGALRITCSLLSIAPRKHRIAGGSETPPQLLIFAVPQADAGHFLLPAPLQGLCCAHRGA